MSEEKKIYNVDEELGKLESSKTGLSSSEATARIEKYGLNALEEKKKSKLQIFLHTLSGPINILIEVACLLSLLMRDWADFWVILFMLCINSAIEFFQTIQASNALEALKNSMAPKSKVMRDGDWTEIEAKLLVPGDIINISNGTIVPADCIMLNGEYISIDQAALTGESLPVNKKIGEEGYSGSVVKAGDMDCLVTTTGGNTFFGKIASLAQQETQLSHFQKSVNSIGQWLTGISLLFVAVVFIKMLFQHENMREVIPLVLVIIVASIPVAMQAILTITMALGAISLAKQKAIVSRLQAIEEMAAVNILCSDKTGTLTKNQLTLNDPILFEGKTPEEVFLYAGLASKWGSDEAIDMTCEKGAGGKEAMVEQKFTQDRFLPFDPVTKMTTGFITDKDGNKFIAIKGAPKVIIDSCDSTDEEKQKAHDEVHALALKGYRALGVARAEGDDKDNAKFKLTGILSLYDPPRDDSKQVIEEAKGYGLKVKMVTGDDLAIGRETSAQLGMGTNFRVAADLFKGIEGVEAMDDLPRSVERKIVTADGFARVFPEHKYGIVKAYQNIGRTVAMTGDGVNDAPALKAANVGIAVEGATDAARASADLILTAPGLSVVIHAIEEARKIFNIMVSYMNYRIVMTLDVLLFISLAIIFSPLPKVPQGTPMTAIMIVMVAILDDIPMMAIAYDNSEADPLPMKWNERDVFVIGIIMGIVAVIQNFILYGILEHPDLLVKVPGMFRNDIFSLGYYKEIQTVLFLQIAVAGHLILFISRHKTKWFWQSPRPSAILFWSIFGTQVVAVIMCYYGWLGMEKISLQMIALVWAYDIAWMFIFNAARIVVEKMFTPTSEKAKYRLLNENLYQHTGKTTR